MTAICVFPMSDIARPFIICPGVAPEAAAGMRRLFRATLASSLGAPGQDKARV